METNALIGGPRVLARERDGLGWAALRWLGQNRRTELGRAKLNGCRNNVDLAAATEHGCLVIEVLYIKFTTPSSGPELPARRLLVAFGSCMIAELEDVRGIQAA